MLPSEEMFQVLGPKNWWSCGFYSNRNKIRVATSKCSGDRWAAAGFCSTTSPSVSRSSWGRECLQRGQCCREDSAADPLPTWHISLLFSFLPPSRVSVARKEPIYHEWCLFNKTSLDNRRNKTHLRGCLASENRAESDAWIPILRPSWWVCSCSRLRAGFSTAVDRERATVSVFVLLDLFSLAWKGIFFFF